MNAGAMEWVAYLLPTRCHDVRWISDGLKVSRGAYGVEF